MTRVLLFSLLLWGAACTDKKPATPAPLRNAPMRLEPLERVLPADAGERDAVFDVAPFTPVGPEAPANAVKVPLEGDKPLAFDVKTAAKDVPVLLVPVGDTYLAQVQGTLAALEDAGLEVWLAHPDGAIAWKLTLRDEKEFQMWLEQIEPGKLRVIQRADGFELSTNMGKLPGGDPNGPSVPARGGKMDLATLQKGLKKLKSRFDAAPDVCFMPSYGTELADVARAMAANATAADAMIFPGICLVYPRPKPAPAK